MAIASFHAFRTLFDAGRTGLWPNRGIKRWVAPYLKELKRRRNILGPEPLKHRSIQVNWNYNAELFAFGKRLGEEFRDESLRTALTHRSYVQQEESKRKELGFPSEAALDLKENTELGTKGEILMSEYIKAYVRNMYPFLPEEGISAVHDFLVSDDILAHVASNLGVADLILCADFPPEKSTLSRTLKSIVGILEQDQSSERAEHFVLDFVLTQLVGRDINEIFELQDPARILTKILHREGKANPEFRLLRESGKNNILAVYEVGVYVDREFIGSGMGETIAVAQDMAASDALRRLFHTTVEYRENPYGKRGRDLKLTYGKPNPTLSEWSSQLVMDRLKTLQ